MKKERRLRETERLVRQFALSGSCIITARRGRPPVEAVARKRQFKIMLSDREIENLRLCSKLSGLTMTGVLRTGIDFILQDLL